MIFLKSNYQILITSICLMFAVNILSAQQTESLNGNNFYYVIGVRAISKELLKPIQVEIKNIPHIISSTYNGKTNLFDISVENKKNNYNVKRDLKNLFLNHKLEFTEFKRESEHSRKELKRITK